MNQIIPNIKPLVKQDGQPQFALVGEAPGEQEEREGQPFVGASGQELDKLLNKHKIIRSTCFIGNVFQRRPPKGDLGKMTKLELRALKSSPEWLSSVETLRQELIEVNPEIIFALGEHSLQTLTGREGITKWRGSLLPNILTGQGKVFPTFHPAYFLRQWKNRCVVDFDIGKAYDIAITKNYGYPQRHFVVNPTFTEAMAILKSFHNKPKLAIDFENTTDTGCPICLGFAPSKDFAISIPIGKWELEEERQIWREIASLMNNPNIGKIFHNALHDLLVFAKWMHIIPVNLCMDTMQAWHNCYPELPKSLAFVASILTNQPYYKDMHKDSDEGDDEKGWSRRAPKDKLYSYNCTDCCVTYEVAEALELELDANEARAGFEMDMSLIPVALGMMYKGILIDKERAAKHLASIESKIGDVDKVIEGVFKGVNTKSSKQMQELLYKTLGLPIKYKFDKKTGTKRPTANEDALLELANKYQSPQLLLLLQNRRLRTRENFVKPPIAKDGRIHPQWKVSSTETFRWAGGECFLIGRSLMNTPDWSRDIYQADPGMIFIGFDKQQAEARFVAYKGFICTGDHSYKDLIESGEKIHVWFMKRLAERRICPMTIEEITEQLKQPEEQRSEAFGTWYFIAKKAIHAFSYGLGPIKFCKEVLKESSKSGENPVFIETQTAKRVKEALYESISTIPKWQQAIQAHLRSSRTINTTFGRTRLFLERWGEDLFGEAYAYEPQATASGDDVNRAILDCVEALPGLEVLQQNYDSMLGQLPESQCSEGQRIIGNVAQKPMTIWNFQHTQSIDIIVPITIKVGRNWGDFDEVNNPEGMKEVR